ncbi:MAG TPA: ATP-binding protein [Sphingobium sp.]
MHRIVRSAAYRIALVYALGFTAAMLVLGLAALLFTHFALTRQLEGQIAQEAAALQAEYQLEGFQALDLAIREREAGQSANELLYAVFTHDGHRVSGHLDSAPPPAGWSDLIFHDPVEGSDLARSWAVNLGGGLRLVVAADTSVVDRVDRQLLLFAGIALIAILLLNLTGALILGAYLRRRLSAISGAADRIMVEDMTRRVPLSGTDDEFDALALSLNRMLDRIAALLDNLRQISSDVAHDLRTPLARLRGHLEECVETETDDERRDRFEVALDQTDRLLSLFGAILRISEVEGGRRRARFQPFDLSGMVAEIAESYALPIEDGGRILTVAIARGMTMTGDRELLAQALINLLDNAQLHTAAGTRIELRLERDGDHAMLRLDDDGPGVPAGTHQAIFRRFVRLDPARAMAGHGLGLNLVAAIVSLHRGTIEAGDNRPGLSVTLRLPLR